MVAWVPGVAYCCVAFMGYIKYSWVRGKHTVQYPELTHVIHTEINYLPGPRAGLHPLSTRPWHTPSDCRHVCECVEMYVGAEINDKSSRKSSFEEMTKWWPYQYLVRLGSQRLILLWSGRGSISVRSSTIQMVRDQSRSLKSLSSPLLWSIWAIKTTWITHHHWTAHYWLC